jgi:hypothetical protein
MKTIKQIEKEINRRLDEYKFHKGDSIGQRDILVYINGMTSVLNKKERLAISEKTREWLLKATKEFRNGQDN